MSGRPIKHGSTDQSTVIRIVDATDGAPETAVEHNTSGIDLWYRREGAAKVSITEAALASAAAAHSDGGIEHIGDGYYRLDLPDAAVASGVSGVMVGGTVTGMVVIGSYHPLVAYDPADAVRLGLTALPNAAADAAGGLPISDAGGLDLDAIKTVTDALPDAGALTTIDGKLDTIAGYIDTEVATIVSNLAAVLTDTGTTLDSKIDAIQAAIDGLSIPAASANADAVLAAGDVDGYSVEEALKVILAAAAGKLSGAATTTIAIRAADDSKARITATVDEDGNRSAVTIDETG